MRTDGRTEGQTDRQTDVTRLRVSFHNFSNAPKQCLKLKLVKQETLKIRMTRSVLE